jgi:hypothetical protein
MNVSMMSLTKYYLAFSLLITAYLYIKEESQLKNSPLRSYLISTQEQYRRQIADILNDNIVREKEEQRRLPVPNCDLNMTER